MLYPAFGMQQLLRQKCMGVKWWRLAQKSRQENKDLQGNIIEVLEGRTIAEWKKGLAEHAGKERYHTCRDEDRLDFEFEQDEKAKKKLAKKQAKRTEAVLRERQKAQVVADLEEGDARRKKRARELQLEAKQRIAASVIGTKYER